MDKLDKLLDILDKVIDETTKYIHKLRKQCIKIINIVHSKVKSFIEKRKSIKNTYNPLLMELYNKEDELKKELKELQKTHDELECKISSIKNENDDLLSKINILGELLTKNM